MPDGKIPVNRSLVGFLGLTCLVAAGVIRLVSPDDQLWIGGCIRVGLVVCAFWLALPSRHRDAAWANVSLPTVFGIVVGLLALTRIPMKIVVPIFIFVAVLIVVLRPRSKTRPNRPS